MASFPTTVFAPASKSGGQTIQAAHVNDLQDEVVAIEGGYLNGTARLNSSHSTLAALSVTGPSTIASTMTIGTLPYVFPSSGGSTGHVLTIVSTSGSTMGLEWRPTAVSVPDAVLVESTGQNFAAASTTAVTWTVQNLITNSSMHSTASAPERLTPQSTGVYLIGAQIVFGNGFSTNAQFIIEDSSGGRVSHVVINHIAAAEHTLNTSVLKRFDALGGWVRVVARYDSASTSSILGGVGRSFFSMVKL